MTVKEFWNKYVLRRREVVVAPEPYVTPDEQAAKLVEEANQLFQAVHDARERAAEVLEHAARQAEQSVEALREQAEGLATVARERLEKAHTSREVAAKLKDFLS